MSKDQIKLVRWPQLVLMITATLVGALFQPAKRYFLSGHIDIQDLIPSLIVFLIGLVIIFIVTFYANKAEE